METLLAISKRGGAVQYVPACLPVLHFNGSLNAFKLHVSNQHLNMMLPVVSHAQMAF